MVKLWKMPLPQAVYSIRKKMLSLFTSFALQNNSFIPAPLLDIALCLSFSLHQQFPPHESIIMFSAHFLSLAHQHLTLKIHNALVTAEFCKRFQGPPSLRSPPLPSFCLSLWEGGVKGGIRQDGAEI